MTIEGTTIKEYDGGRSIRLTVKDGYVYLEFGETCLAFDERILVHQASREFGMYRSLDTGSMALTA